MHTLSEYLAIPFNCPAGAYIPFPLAYNSPASCDAVPTSFDPLPTPPLEPAQSLPITPPQQVINIKAEKKVKKELDLTEACRDLVMYYEDPQNAQEMKGIPPNLINRLIQPVYRPVVAKGRGSRHGKEYYVCLWPGCKYTVARKPHIITHVATHGGYKRFFCEIWFVFGFDTEIPTSN
jgi:hypothetical protein